MAKVKYKTVDTRTEKGLKEAERLHDQGWLVNHAGFWSIQFYKPESVKKNPSQSTQNDYGWGIIINEYPAERNFYDLQDDGEINEDEEIDWEYLSNSIIKVEANVLGWIRKKFGPAQDEGHDTDDTLIGTIWVESGSEADDIIKDLIEADEPLQDWGLEEERIFFKGIKGYARKIIEVEVVFFK